MYHSCYSRYWLYLWFLSGTCTEKMMCAAHLFFLYFMLSPPLCVYSSSVQSRERKCNYSMATWLYVLFSPIDLVFSNYSVLVEICSYHMNIHHSCLILGPCGWYSIASYFLQCLMMGDIQSHCQPQVIICIN